MVHFIIIAISHTLLSHTLRSHISHLVEIERAVFGLEDDDVVQINLEVNVLMGLVRKRRAEMFSDNRVVHTIRRQARTRVPRVVALLDRLRHVLVLRVLVERRASLLRNVWGVG